MALPLWYEFGRRFALAAYDGLHDAGCFIPAKAIDEWIDFGYGSGLPPFDSDEAADIIRWCATQRSVRRAFAHGYRDGMAETRTSRRAERAANRKSISELQQDIAAIDAEMM